MNNKMPPSTNVDAVLPVLLSKLDITFSPQGIPVVCPLTGRMEQNDISNNPSLGIEENCSLGPPPIKRQNAGPLY